MTSADEQPQPPPVIDGELPPGADDRLESGAAGHRFLRGATLRSLGYVTGLLLGALVTPFITRHLGSVNWGRYVTVTSLMFIASALTEGGLANMGVRELSSGSTRDREEYMAALLGLRVVLTAVAAVLAVGFVVAAGYPPVEVAGVAISCFALLVTNLQYTIAIMLTVRLRLGWQALTDFLTQIIGSVVMIGLVLDHASLLPFFTATTIAGIVTLTITYRVVRGEMVIRFLFDPSRWRALLTQSVVYAAATALGVVYFQIVVVVTSLLSTAVQSGYFGLAFRVISIVNSLPWLLTTSAFPILARAAQTDVGRLRNALQQMFDTGLVAGGILALGLVIGAPFVVTVVGGSDFAGSVLTLQILGAALPATFLIAVGAFALLALQRYQDLIVVNGLAVALAITLSVLIIPGLGSEGAAIVSTALECSLATGYLIALRRADRSLRPRLTRVPRMAVAFGLSTGIGFVVPLPSLPATIVAMAVLAVLLYVLRLLPTEILAAVRRRPVA